MNTEEAKEAINLLEDCYEELTDLEVEEADPVLVEGRTTAMDLTAEVTAPWQCKCTPELPLASIPSPML